VLDEAAYAKPRLVFETLLPLLGMKDAALIGISTPLGSDNWLTAAINIKDEYGIPYFPVIQLGLVCQKCMQTAQVDIINQCKHMKGLTPPWKSEQNTDRIKKITELLDDKGRAMRENMGIVTDSVNIAFNTAHLEKWFSILPTIETGEYPEKIYVTVDPDAAGATSCCSVVSGYRIKNKNSNYQYMNFVVC
jgi:hypothetical protein